MIGLALEGGGTRGSYQAGAYLAFLECNIKIDGVCGTSIGALNGAVIASGKGFLLPRIWRNSNMDEIFNLKKEYEDENKLSIKHIKSFLINIVNVIANKGINLEGLKKLIDDQIDIDALINSQIDFGLVTVRLKDLKPLCIFKKDMTKENIKEYILASCFLPIFKKEKLIDNEYYLDGGFYDVGPVNMLLDKGYQKVYLIKNYGLGIHRKYNQEKVTVIEPKRSLGLILDFDPKRIEENIKMGYYDTIRLLKGLDGINYCFKPKKENYYKKLNKNIPSIEYRRLKNFFSTKTEKDTIIKALEYIMEKENINYYHIYKVRKIIKVIKKKYKNKDHFIYQYIKKLRFF